MLFVSVAGLLWLNEAQALQLSMKRIVFEGPKRSDIITIMNNSAREQTYRIGWRHYRMDEQKSLVYIKEGEEGKSGIKWADDMIRYAPRRVTVPAGGSQQIRILLRRPRDLEPGEYRSHLWIVSEAPPEAFDPNRNKQAGQQAFRLTMQPAMTMPIFVRHGDFEAAASITEPKLVRSADGAVVSFVLNRSGNRSLYGDVKVICTGNGEFVASHIRGIAVYTEVKRRVFEYEIIVPPEKAAGCGAARIEYVADRDDTLYGGQVMARADVRM
ncbi:MAG: hypothetical protein H6867_05120 [Rhodospirillales bacterium]|nr:hypothetical protein [Rhodospirillales bacterium]MCB9994909.1 hypothetical protein [Rhodospirillales bacterium]